MLTEIRRTPRVFLDHQQALHVYTPATTYQMESKNVWGRQQRPALLFSQLSRCLGSWVHVVLCPQSITIFFFAVILYP